jgi:hypothetical protein
MGDSAELLERNPTMDATHGGPVGLGQRLLTAGIGALLLSMGPVAHAALDPALIGGQIFFNLQPPAGVNFTTFGTHTLPGLGGLIEFVAAPTPSPFLSGDVSVPSNITGRASGTLIYSMQVVGPTSPDPVPVLAAFAGGVAGSSGTDVFTAGFSMDARWSLADANLGLQEVFHGGIDMTTTRQGNFSDSFNEVAALGLIAGHIYRVTMVVDVFAGASGSVFPASGSAFIDPVFSFGPGVSPGYSFVFSEGIGNTAPVPEPTTWAMFALGLLALSLRGRRRAA